MINIIQKIFEAYNEEDWDNSYSLDEFSNTITQQVQYITSMLHFKLKYKGIQEKYSSRIELFNIFYQNDTFLLKNISDSIKNRIWYSLLNEDIIICIGTDHVDITACCRYSDTGYIYLDLKALRNREKAIHFNNEEIIDLYIKPSFVQFIDDVKKNILKASDANMLYFKWPGQLFAEIPFLIEVIEFPDLSILDNNINLTEIFSNSRFLRDVRSIGDTSKVISFEGLFKNCISLKTVPEFDLASNNHSFIRMDDMFAGDILLKNITIKGKRTADSVSIVDMFFNCKNLVNVDSFILPDSLDHDIVRNMDLFNSWQEVFYMANSLSLKTINEWEIEEEDPAIPFLERIKKLK